MPLQYKIEYRWDDKVADAKKAKKRSRNSFNSPRPHTLLTERSGNQSTGSGEKTSLGDRSAISKTNSNKKERGKTSSLGLEKVVLPAGYCVYYARGRGGSLLQSDPHQGTTTRSGSKGLGVVNPDSHNLAEEEYAIIREVMEIYLEKQVREGEEGNRYRAGGQLHEHRQLLDELMLALPDIEEKARMVSDANHVQAESPQHQTETAATSSDTSKPLPTARNSSRCLLPISKALQMELSPRGPFLVEGQAVLDTSREGSSEHPPQDTQPEELHSEETSEDHQNPEKDVTFKYQPESCNAAPPQDVSQDSSQDLLKDQLKGGALSIDLRSLSSHIDSSRHRGQLSQAKIGFLRTFRHQNHDHRLSQFRRKGCVTSRPLHRVVTHSNVPLQVVSERSPMEARTRNTSRSSTRITQRTTPRLSQEIFSMEKPTSPIFQETLRRRPLYRNLQHWQPITSCLHQNLMPDISRPLKQDDVDGHSFVTKMPSKIILNVVLPRENKSRDDRLCNRRVTTPNRPVSGPNQPPPQAWLSTITSPPPPPPPSAPSNADADDIQAYYLVHDDDAEDHDCDTIHSSSSSSRSAASLPLSVAEFQSPNAVEGLMLVTPPTCEKNGLCSDLLEHAEQPPLATGNNASSTDPISTNEAATELRIHATSRQQNSASNTVSAITGAQDTSTMFTHLDTSAKPSSTPTKERADTQQTQTSCQRATHCDILGPDLCADCEAAQHRLQFTAEQEILYPHINVTPRHLIAATKIRGRQFSKGDHSQGAGWSQMTSPPNWPYVSERQLNNVVTDLELCKRIVEKGHRARLPSNFS